MKLAVISDIDGTLFRVNVRGDQHTWTDDFLPGVESTLDALARLDVPLILVTNQAGPLWSIITRDSKYQTSDEVSARLLRLAEKIRRHRVGTLLLVSVMDLGLLERSRGEKHLRDCAERVQRMMTTKLAGCGIPCIVSEHPSWRKPHPGMLNYALRQMNLSARDAIYCGDRDEDRAAASVALIDFRDARDFSTIPAWMETKRRSG